jgi:hypothetical protein
VARAPRHSYVLRDTATSVVFWLGAALGIILVGDPLLRGDVALFARTAPFVALALWLMFVVMFHPHIRYDEERAVVTNIGRVHELPWSRVVTVRQTLNLGFELDDGRRISAVGVTAARGRGLILSGLTKGKLGVGSEEFHQHADALRPLQEAAARSDAPVVSRWDTVPLVIGAVLALAVAVDLVVLLAG